MTLPDIQATRSLLPCIEFEVFQAHLELSTRSDEWMLSAIPRAAGLATDILAAELLSGRFPSFDESAKKAGCVKLSIYIDPKTGKHRWLPFLGSAIGETKHYWSFMKRPLLDWKAQKNIEACVCSAVECAKLLHGSTRKSEEVNLQYAASWRHLSNHERMAFQDAARIPFSQAARARGVRL